MLVAGALGVVVDAVLDEVDEDVGSVLASVVGAEDTAVASTSSTSRRLLPAVDGTVNTSCGRTTILSKFNWKNHAGPRCGSSKSVTRVITFLGLNTGGCVPYANW